MSLNTPILIKPVALVRKEKNHDHTPDNESFPFFRTRLSTIMMKLYS